MKGAKQGATEQPSKTNNNIVHGSLKIVPEALLEGVAVGSGGSDDKPNLPPLPACLAASLRPQELVEGDVQGLGLGGGRHRAAQDLLQRGVRRAVDRGVARL